MKRALLVTGAALALALAVFFWIGSRLESFINRVEPVPLPPVSDAARRLHASATVVDLHADSLLFGRDLLQRSDVGHVDLPRLRDGGVGIQFFTAATVFPIRANMDRTERDDLDAFVLAGLAQRSRSAFLGPLGRAILQANRLRAAVAGSGDGLVLVRSRHDLESLLERREREPRVVGAVLGIEGAHALEGDLGNLDMVYDAGYRMIGLAHFFDNEFAGSAHGVEKGGLTDLGRELIREMERRGMLVDLAHTSDTAVREILAMVDRPTVVSHGGVKGTCDNNRTISDELVRAIAAGGGVVGIGFWPDAVCGRTPGHIVAAIRYVVDLVGDDHVALGSDYDGGTTVGFDIASLPALTQAMLDAGLAPASIRKILGGNAVRVLRATLP